MRALISVSDKTGVVEFARGLRELGWQVIATGGTMKLLAESGVEVINISDVTGFPEICDGRVKTLHPKVHGGLLARRDDPNHLKALRENGIEFIDMVCVNLYPFRQTIAREGVTMDEAIENIDIGGPSMLRSAAKNYKDVTVVCDPADYDTILAEIRGYGNTTPRLRLQLSAKAYTHTAEYDAMIATYMREKAGLDEKLFLEFDLVQPLRYGENPHQQAALFMPPLEQRPFEQLSGKELSYNNLLDLDTLLRGCSVFQDSCACTIVKHTTPCGTARGETPIEAFKKALACDPVSAFGGIIGMTRKVDLDTAKTVTETFFEILAAPDFEEGVVEYLKEKKPNLRVLKILPGYAPKLQILGNRCGFLVQEDKLPALPRQSEGEWHGKPRPDLWEDIIFAWKTAAITKSNAIVLVKDGAAVGIGGGFTNRVDAAEYAIKLAGDKAKGSVMASDAFFPFADSVELAHKAGVIAVIEPGGSIRDNEVFEKAEELGLSLFAGGSRTFRH